ncbi:hypothetical protein [Halobacillus seohaensis]|uniref:Uncharacterized protein n=1 Tax=Halobacillus seohaensis TaxID=447421 RepID=A0ABW2EQE0_9BACI
MSLLVDITISLMLIISLIYIVNYLVIVNNLQKCIDYISGKKANFVVRLYYIIRDFWCYYADNEKNDRKLYLSERLAQTYLKIKILISRLESFPFSLLGCITIVFLFFLLYWFIPLNSIIFYDLWVETFKIIGIKGYVGGNEATIYEIMKSVIKAMSIAFSVLLTLYIFTYRERKTFSVSLNNAMNSNNFSFLIILVTVIYGNLLLVLVKSNQLFNSVLSINRFITLLLLLLISSYVLVKVIKDMILGIDYNYTINKSIKDMDDLSYISHLAPNGKQKDYIDDYVIRHIEGFNQVISYCIDNDLYDYSKLLNEWEKILVAYKTGPPKAEEVMNANRFYLSNNVSGDKVYKTFMNIHLSIILYLAEHNRYAEAITCVEQLNDLLSPAKGFNELKNVYLSSLHRLFTITQEEHPIVSTSVLDQLSKYSSHEILTDKFISLDIFTAIMTRCVEKGDVNQLSIYAYSILDAREIKNKDQVIKTKTQIDDKMLQYLRRKMTNQTFNKAYIYSIFQVCLKSLEIGNYPAVGFLMKFLITNFHRTNELKETFTKLYENRGEVNPYIQLKDKDNDYFNRFIFKTSADEYCIRKLGILLFGQQIYSDYYNLPKKTTNIKKSIDHYVDIRALFSGCDYYKYTFSKIESAKNDFGLLFLKESDFLKTLNKLNTRLIKSNDIKYFEQLFNFYIKKSIKSS